jgi:hypothetical protein
VHQNSSRFQPTLMRLSVGLSLTFVNVPTFVDSAVMRGSVDSLQVCSQRRAPLGPWSGTEPMLSEIAWSLGASASQPNLCLRRTRPVWLWATAPCGPHFYSYGVLSRKAFLGAWRTQRLLICGMCRSSRLLPGNRIVSSSKSTSAVLGNLGARGQHFRSADATRKTCRRLQTNTNAAGDVCATTVERSTSSSPAVDPMGNH